MTVNTCTDRGLVSSQTPDIIMCGCLHVTSVVHAQNNSELLDEVEQNIVICLWQADQLFAEAKG